MPCVKTAVSRQWDWLRGYNGGLFADDLVAAIIVTILLVPQSLAYALLAGLPPQVGIYVLWVVTLFKCWPYGCYFPNDSSGYCGST